MEKKFISRLLNWSVRSAWTLSFMNQRQIVVFLYLNALPAKDTHTELVELLASDAIAHLTATKHRRQDAILQNEPEAEH
jgi:hypothetical protein